MNIAPNISKLNALVELFDIETRFAHDAANIEEIITACREKACFCWQNNLFRAEMRWRKLATDIEFVRP